MSLRNDIVWVIAFEDGVKCMIIVLYKEGKTATTEYSTEFTWEKETGFLFCVRERRIGRKDTTGFMSIISLVSLPVCLGSVLYIYTPVCIPYRFVLCQLRRTS